MSIVERLQAIVKERGTNFKQLEADCGLGNGVIRRWDAQSPRLDKLVKVANYLNVSLDYLVYGRGVSDSSENSEPVLGSRAAQEAQSLMCDGSPLEDEEADLVAMYRLLPSHVQEDMFDQIFCLYRKYAERKRESIYWTYKADKLKRKATDADSDLSGSGQGGIA